MGLVIFYQNILCCLLSISINLSSSSLSYLIYSSIYHHLHPSAYQYLSIYHTLSLSIKTFMYVCMCMYLSKISQSSIPIYLAIISQSVIYHLSLYVFLSSHNFINFIEVILFQLFSHQDTVRYFTCI